MPRKARSYDKHVPDPDPKFGSVKYAKFINYMMERGKKNVARKIFYDALDIVSEKMANQPAAAAPVAAADKDGKPAPEKKLDGRAVFEIALKNIAPLMELKSRRSGGANYQVPMEVMEPRRTAIGMKWLIAAARAKKGMPMKEKLAQEIMDGYNKQGAAMKKREDTHRMAEANKAFAHFARFGRR
jgi:small subunit ribosomal protein S7